MYSPNKTAEEHFEEIRYLAHEANQIFFPNTYSSDTLSFFAKRILVENISKITNQIIFEVYYILYLILGERKSIRNFYINDYGLDNLESRSLSSDSLYEMFVEYYEKYRKSKDEAAQTMYNNDEGDTVDDENDENSNKSVDVGILKKKTRENAFEGYKLQLTDYYFVKRCCEIDSINYTMKVLKDSRLHNNKSVKKIDLNEKVFKGIDDIYELIKSTKYVDDSRNMNYFLRCIDFYQLEKNCSLELSYNAAYAVTNIKKKLKDKKDDIEVFRHLRYSKQILHNEEELYAISLINNRAFLIPKFIFSKYLSGKISTEDVDEIYYCVNYIIHNSIYFCLQQYFGGYFNRPITDDFFINIYEGSDVVKEECGLDNIDEFMCETTEEFFKDFVGKGQHITEKDWNSVKDANFREMYIELQRSLII